MSQPVGTEQRRAGHHREHTDETLWRTWPGWTGLPDVDLPTAGGRVVVVSAHPDDDVLAVGGLLQRLGERGCDVAFVCCSDGEASHPGSPTVTATELARHRAAELRRALARLGHASSAQVSLHLPDGRLGCGLDRLAALLAPHLVGAAAILAPWRGDGHPDHEACGHAAVAAAAAGSAAGPPVWEYPVWAWHWATPDSSTLPWRRARMVRLRPDERVAKADAVGCFASQLEPLSEHPADARVLPPAVLAHFSRAFEAVFT